VNGLGAEIEAGRIAFEAPFAGLRVWPSPARAGNPLRVTFFAPLGSLGLPASDLSVAVYDVRGRRVKTLAEGQIAPAAGLIQISWDLRDERGGAVGGGV
jgi:hypothetical protein